MSGSKQFIIVDGQVFISAAEVSAGAFSGLAAGEAMASPGSVISDSGLTHGVMLERKLTIDEMACIEIDYIRDRYGRSLSSVEMWSEAYEVARHRVELRDGPAPTPESVSGEGWRLDFKDGGFELFNTIDGKIRARMSGDILDAKPATMYDWSVAPAWAKFAFTCPLGVCFWAEEKPKATTQGWEPLMGNRLFMDEFTIHAPVKNWRETLEARPK